MATLSKTKQALRSSIAKGSQTHKASILTGSIITIARELLEVSPQKVAEADEGDATRDTYQRKVFFNGTNFFVVFWTGSPTKQVQYVASSDGKKWTNPVVLWTFSVAPYYGGNVDIQYPNRGAKDASGYSSHLSMHFTGSNGQISSWNPFTISGQTLNKMSGGMLGGLQLAQGDSVVANLNGASEYMMYHRANPDGIYLHRSPANQDDYDTSVTHGGSDSGGNQLLPYKTNSPYNMLALAKGSNYKLYYNIVNVAANYVASFKDAFIEIATLGAGFSDFCACSEAQNIGDPERIHLIYIKSTGELCYKKFENDAWSSEKVLVSSGASYPVIACGKGGRLYLFYVKDGVIKLLKYDGTQWQNEQTLFPEHTYNNPTYLSTNQNEQHGQICLVWTEGTTAPYEVWFCTIGDA